jgi:hypothetical protein
MRPPSKKRKATATEEVSFDPSAREEYLTGFHKRKVARIKHAQEDAAKQAREEKIRARAEVRDSIVPAKTVPEKLLVACGVGLRLALGS